MKLRVRELEPPRDLICPSTSACSQHEKHDCRNLDLALECYGSGRACRQSARAAHVDSRTGRGNRTCASFGISASPRRKLYFDKFTGPRATVRLLRRAIF